MAMLLITRGAEMKYSVKIILTLLMLLVCTVSVAFENIFYVLRNDTLARMAAAKQAEMSLNNHFKAINILISQAYQVDEDGNVWGAVNQEIADFVTQHGMKLMLLITNPAFSKDIAHRFFANKVAQEKAVQTIVAACKKQHCYGVQFDYEMIPVTDREALTRFYQLAADILHKNKLVVSFAVAPLVAESPQASDFLKKIYVNWEGAYDLKKLGEIGDFVTVMAYNQHGGATTPGPTASILWVEASIKTALQFIPAEKISLGIPAYSTYWFTGTDDVTGRVAVNSVGISYEKMNALLQKYHVTLQWDEKRQLNATVFEHNWLSEYIFAEDALSFKAKYELAKKYQLRGISVFDLGTEDPQIWTVLK